MDVDRKRYGTKC